MSITIRPARLWALALMTGFMLFAAPAVMAGGFGYTLSLLGPGYGVSYSGCSACRGAGWVSAYAGTGWGWAPYPYGGYAYTVPGYSYYSSYDDDYDNRVSFYSSPWGGYREYRTWRYRGWRRDRDEHYRGWQGDHDYYRDRGWHRVAAYGGYRQRGWNHHDDGYWGHQRNERNEDHGWHRDRGASGRWSDNHYGDRGQRGDRDGHR